MKKAFIALSFLLFSLGCASNPFSEFYYDNYGGQDITKIPSLEISNSDPTLNRGSSPDFDYEKMSENGYYLIGHSSFNGAQIDERDALTQAKRIHASVVVMCSRYSNTRTGIAPISTPSMSTSNTTLTGNINGSYGSSSTLYGNANTTTWNTQTTYVPYSVDRFDYYASFWVKGKPPRLGVQIKDLTQEQRAQINSNKGVFVTIVIKGSPAFYSDFFKGDIIRSIASADIYDFKSLVVALDQFAGQEVEVKLLRDGKEITKKVKLNEPPK